ncbi:hypothetical protein ONQ62_26940, partial [Salmonella enterica subsp. enterica serovar Virginia]|nr:hypothetical protein [Salmonella enterica subsp. enterica serovar Virginia]
FELAAESPLMMIMFNSLSQQIYQRYPQATIKVRNWDYDSLEALGFAVQNPATPFGVFMLIALLCGFAGANFASSMGNISFFFPK